MAFGSAYEIDICCDHTQCRNCDNKSDRFHCCGGGFAYNNGIHCDNMQCINVHMKNVYVGSEALRIRLIHVVTTRNAGIVTYRSWGAQ